MVWVDETKRAWMTRLPSGWPWEEHEGDIKLICMANSQQPTPDKTLHWLSGLCIFLVEFEERDIKKNRQFILYMLLDTKELKHATILI